MTAISHSCEACGAVIEGADLSSFGDAFLVHVRADHADWPFPDVAVRNYAEATQRLTGSAERLAALGAVSINPVTADRIDDWTNFFDHDGFVGRPEWAACYCTEPHLRSPVSEPPADDHRTWQQNRESMQTMLQDGRSRGYLAYVDGRPAGWINASKRSDYALFRMATADVDDGDVIGVTCFVIAPPYRRHGLAGQLLDFVIDDAPARGVSWVEAYPFAPGRADNDANFRGSRSMYASRGFEVVEDRAHDSVVRRPVSG